MKPEHAASKFHKYLLYVLGRRPDEFGLVLDGEGFVKIKELLKAISEEEDLRGVRQRSIDDVLVFVENPGIEISDKKIRATDRSKLPQKSLEFDVPKLLYTCVRNRAHANVVTNGIFPQGADSVSLSPDKDMAVRIGKRKGQNPIVLTVNVQTALEYGCEFLKIGDLLFLSEYIPADCFAAPPLPREKDENLKNKSKAKKSSAKQEDSQKDKTPGSFTLQLDEETFTKRKKQKVKGKKKEIAWKKTRREQRKIQKE